MEVINRVLPNSEQMAGFLKDPEEGPIYMVNLLKFKAQAEYVDGRVSSLTGQEAYGLYAEGVQKLLEAVGGSVTFAGEVSRLTLGEVEELWDEVAIACYPTRGAMLQMMQLPEMAEIASHRAAGLAGQLNIECLGDPAFGARAV